jgi:hypothetical protein
LTAQRLQFLGHLISLCFLLLGQQVFLPQLFVEFGVTDRNLALFPLLFCVSDLRLEHLDLDIDVGDGLKGILGLANPSVDLDLA